MDEVAVGVRRAEDRTSGRLLVANHVRRVDFEGRSQLRETYEYCGPELPDDGDELRFDAGLTDRVERIVDANSNR